jgi:voltage-gated sodium channel
MLNRFFLDDRKLLWPIVVNAVVLFALGFSQLPAAYVGPLNTIDDAITTLFVIELAVKIRTWGWPKYWSSNWNKFDFVLIALSMPSLAGHFLDMRGIDLSFLLALRICRVFKFFRFLRFIPGIEQMLRGVHRALRASVMLLLAFFLALFMVSLISAKLFGSIDPEHYGDPLRALYSTFKIFTVEGWYEIPDDVTSHMSGVGAFFARSFFALLLLGAGIMGLSLVNSVFVDAMVADNNEGLEKKLDELSEDIARLRADLRRTSLPPPPGGAGPPPVKPPGAG